MAKKTTRTARRPAEKQPGSHLLDDGTLTVQIKDGPHSGKSFQIDILAAKLACEAVEAKHRVGAKDFTVSAALLDDLAAAFKSLPGVDYCTPTMAYKLWCAVAREFIALKKSIG